MSTDLETVIQRDDQFYPYQERQVEQATKAVSALTAKEPDIIEDSATMTEESEEITTTNEGIF